MFSIIIPAILGRFLSFYTNGNRNKNTLQCTLLSGLMTSHWMSQSLLHRVKDKHWTTSRRSGNNHPFLFRL